MNAYEYEIEGFYTGTYGWEPVTTANSKEEALRLLADYRANERVPFRIKRKKVSV